MANEITNQQMIAFIDCKITVCENHIEYYKKFLQDKSYMYEELKILKSIKETLTNTAPGGSGH